MKRGVDNRVEKCFGAILRTHRLALGLSQEELAFRAQIDRTFVSMLERGLRMPSLGTILTVARALDISAKNLIAELETELD
jgi:transcriptional regulator with XRE-family HTH domain